MGAESRRYLTLADQNLYSNPETLYEYMLHGERAEWGIEVEGAGTELVGSVGITGLGLAYPQMGRLINRTRHLSRGIGTLVAVGVAAYAMDEWASFGLRATTLEVNTRAQKSLGKAGFVQQPPPAELHGKLYPYGTEGEEAEMTYWRLFGPEVDYQADVVSPGMDRALISASAETFQQQREQLDITFEDFGK